MKEEDKEQGGKEQACSRILSRVNHGEKTQNQIPVCSRKMSLVFNI